VNDTLYYTLKRVKGTITGDTCEVIDDEIVAFNFPGKLDKGVRVTSTFVRNKQDSTWSLSGTWKTNATKKYYSITGKVKLQEEKDLGSSKIFPHLEELRLADQVTFYKERKEGIPIVMKRAKPEQIKTEYRNQPDIEAPVVEKKTFAAAELEKPVVPVDKKIAVETKKPDAIATVETKEEIKTAVVEQKKPEPVAKVETKELAKPIITAPKTTTIPVADNKPKATEIKETKPAVIAVVPVKESKPIAKSEVKEKPDTTKIAVAPVIVAKPVTTAVYAKEKPITPAVVEIPVDKKPVMDLTVKTVIESKKSISDLIEQGKIVGGRSTIFTQEVLFKSDSLELALYDNGEIDGDTVSVYVNGEMLLARQGLKASAIKKTIYLKPGDPNDFTLVLFADNLGKYPPNTGLLVVHDGEDTYNLRFSSDLQKSSGIVFKRKR
jgi:hypothetical protein